jgi:NADH-quinone oxidoreductase subunit L
MTSAHAVLSDVEQVSSASGIFSLLWLIVALPLLGALILLAGGRRTNNWGPWLATALPVGSFVLAFSMFLSMLGKPAEGRAVQQVLYSWIPVGELQVDVGFLLDQLSVCFLLLITFVGSLIHIYSLGYMEHDAEKRRFFAYLNLFVASMLLLVLANSYLLLYVGWEGVGLASYLLIGFWQYKPAAATAAKKAFVMNRVGDVGLSIAIMIMFATFGSVAFSGVFGGVTAAGSGTVDAIGLLLLLAACGKSAQVPLQAWLLDAMEGPTPVSALIHAATMVTAGVYLIARSHPIFNVSEVALTAVAVVGCVTLAFGAVIGCAMDDIKKALAGSTMSQIGYMVLAVGLGTSGYSLGIGHLLSHGFFKAGLFLGAGSVMHAMRDRLDMRRYGGLRKVMPITFATFFLGYLAIIGIPPFSGFFTKDPIIDAAYHSGGAEGVIYGLVAQVTAGITAFYMTRVVVMTFFGPTRWHEDDHPHDPPWTMTVPMILLAVGSVGLGAFLMLNNRLIGFLDPVLGEAEAAKYISPLTFVTLAMVVAGAGVAWAMYGRQPVPLTAPAGGPLTVAARESLYGDAVNESLTMRPGQYLTRFLVFFDNRVIDGFVNGFAAVVGGVSSRGRRTQTGFARSYALSMFVGAAVVTLAVVLVRI